jgi:hypothetical protein
MRKIMLFVGVAAVAGCSQQPVATTSDAQVAAEATPTASDAAAAGPATASINGTSWEFTEKGKPMQESIDATGHYYANSGTEHVDHGTVVMKDGKACFTSLMTKNGENCWTTPNVAIGQAVEIVSDKGEKLTVKRVAYVPFTL